MRMVFGLLSFAADCYIVIYIILVKMRSGIYQTEQLQTPKEGKFSHKQSSSTFKETSKSQKHEPFFKSNKLISLSQLLLTERSDHKSPSITPSEIQKKQLKSTSSLANLKQASIGNWKIVETDYLSENKALKKQLKILTEKLQRAKNQIKNSQRYQQQASLQIIKNLNLKISVKSTLIDKITKSLHNFKERIELQNISITPQCRSELQELIQLIKNHDNLTIVQEKISFLPLQKNRIVRIHREDQHYQQTPIRSEQASSIAKIKELQEVNFKAQQELKRLKNKIQQLQEKLISNGFQLHTLDMIKQKWKQSQQKLLKLRHQGENPEKQSKSQQSIQNYDEISLRNQVNILERQKQMLINKQKIMVERITKQQSQRSTILNKLAQDKNNIINKLTLQRNDLFNKWKEALEQIGMLKIKCNIYEKTSSASRQIAQYQVLQQKISSLKQTITEHKETIKHLQQKSTPNTNLKEPEEKIKNQLQELTKKCNQLQVQRDFLIDFIKQSQLTGQNSSTLQKLLADKQTSSKYSRFQQILSKSQRLSFRSFSETKNNEKEFYRYKVDERYLDLKRKIHQIHQTYAHGSSAITFFKKYSEKQLVPQDKSIILQMIRDALAILNKFQQTIIIKKSQLKRFNQNKLKSLEAVIKKTKEQNTALKHKIEQQFSQFKQQIGRNIKKLNYPEN